MFGASSKSEKNFWGASERCRVDPVDTVIFSDLIQILGVELLLHYVFGSWTSLILFNVKRYAFTF